MILSKDQDINKKERKRKTMVVISREREREEREVWQCKDRNTLDRAKERECNEHIMECYKGERERVEICNVKQRAKFLSYHLHNYVSKVNAEVHILSQLSQW